MLGEGGGGKGRDHVSLEASWHRSWFAHGYSYAFCRVADDLIDDAPSPVEAQASVADLRQFLDLAYAGDADVDARASRLETLVRSRFPASTQATLLVLPVAQLSPTPLYELLEGFEMDLGFDAVANDASASRWPIADEDDLMRYALRVAGTVAEMCLDLVFHHAQARYSARQRTASADAGRRMGIALQLVNIARDVVTDARIGRVYLPQSWLEAVGLTPGDVLKDPDRAEIDSLRQRLLDQAERYYHDARPAIEELPPNGRRGMRVAVESYMEIGRVLRQGGPRRPGRATVPRLRRLRVAWQALARS